MDAERGRQITGQKGKRNCAGVLFLYYMPGEEMPVSYRVRRDEPDWGYGKDGGPKPERKYLSAPGSGNRLYFAPAVELSILLEPSVFGVFRGTRYLTYDQEGLT